MHAVTQLEISSTELRPLHRRRPRPALPGPRAGAADHPRDEVLCSASRVDRYLQDTPQENPLKHMTTRTRLRPAAERASPLQQAVTTALDDMKAVNVRVLDVRGLTDIADTMVIASGNSDRHVRSIAERVVEKAKAAGFRPLGTEGARDGGVGAGGPAGHPRARHAAAGTRVLRAREPVGDSGRGGGRRARRCTRAARRRAAR